MRDGAAALDAFAAEAPDLVVLDLMMPNVDGLTVCRRLRAAETSTPILIATARTEVSDRVSGLDAGADDYLPKPFALDELLARMRALLRRDRPTTRRTGSCGSRTCASTRRPGGSGGATGSSSSPRPSSTCCSSSPATRASCSSHSTIYERIWGYDFGSESKSLAVYIGYLRRKTEEDGAARLIQTVRGVGYTLRPS